MPTINAACSKDFVDDLSRFTGYVIKALTEDPECLHRPAMVCAFQAVTYFDEQVRDGKIVMDREHRHIRLVTLENQVYHLLDPVTLYPRLTHFEEAIMQGHFASLRGAKLNRVANVAINILEYFVSAVQTSLIEIPQLKKLHHGMYRAAMSLDIPVSEIAT